MAGFSLQGAADLAARQDDGAEITLVDPETNDPLTYTATDGVEKEVTVRVAGALSNVYRKADDAQRDKMLKRRATTMTGEMLVRQQMELTAACVLSWTLHDGGKPILCTKENILTVFQAAPYIRTQIEVAMHDAARFLR